MSPAKHAKVDVATDAVGMDMEEQHNLSIHSRERDTHLEEFEEDDLYETEGSQDCRPLISQCVLSKLKPTRQRRFIWSDITDR